MKHPVDTSQWGEFKARDLFGPSKLGKYHNPKDLQASDDGYEYICATTMNNGINQTLSCVIGNNLTIPFRIGGGLSLTPPHIIAWGKQNPYFTYHENPCVTSQGMYFVEVKNKTRNQIHFLITVLNKLSSEFSYTNCLTGKLFDELSIPLPLKPSTDPSNYNQDDIDWDYMETVMSRVTARAKDRLANLPQPTDKKKTPVDTSAWGDFVVGELFECNTTKTFYPNKSELPPGNTPYITRSTYDNGISGYYDDIDNEFTIEGNCLTIGAEGGIAFWQPKPFIAGVKVYTIRHPQLNELTALFVASLLNANSANYSYTNAHVLAKIKAESIKLPLKSSADPSNFTQEDIDWNYMENFMKIIEEKAHDRLKSLQKTIA